VLWLALLLSLGGVLIEASVDYYLFFIVARGVIHSWPPQQKYLSLYHTDYLLFFLGKTLPYSIIELSRGRRVLLL
jgi:hypothetical protein